MNIKAITLLAALMLATALAHAAESWYQVEMIVFTHKGASLNSEHWPDDPGRPDGKGAVTLQRGGSKGLAAPGGGFAYQLLDDSAFELNGAYAKLHRSGRYAPLLHLAWKQPTNSLNKTQPVMISTRRTGSTPPKIEGVVRIGRKRYLHADIDLVLNRPTPPGEGLAANGGYGPAYRSYRMKTRRRMRSNELHYLDHPLMGVLLKITPLEQPASKKSVQKPSVEATKEKTTITPN
ncbi:MAG TPA: hypothetical protein EYH03_02500 [Chromatiales bacterium]|nr:hypothetical protein [Chromatiales bacterium]